MRIASCLVAVLLVVCGSSGLHAQVPAIVGTWKFNAEASKFPGPAPQVHVRSYRLTEDGVLVGVAVIVDAEGRPSFLQFAGKPDGKDHPEFNTESAASYLSTGALPPRTYSEAPTSDPLKVKWLDKMNGKLLFSGERWVSADGKRMSFTLDTKDPQGKEVQFLYVFDRTGP